MKYKFAVDYIWRPLTTILDDLLDQNVRTTGGSERLGKAKLTQSLNTFHHTA
jgi:hypothetical protein